MTSLPKYTKKDFETDQDVRWCPGCGDYAILAAVQKVMPDLGIPRENIVFVSGIGCSSRFPYYMNTYGFHTIHGRAPAIATGLKLARPELKVFVVTGDGDGLSIGGNHLLHVLRRNVDLTMLLFNNRIYGLTKGQYSPTQRARQGDQVDADGLDRPAHLSPAAFALTAGATFVARTVDRNIAAHGGDPAPRRRAQGRRLRRDSPELQRVQRPRLEGALREGRQAAVRAEGSSTASRCSSARPTTRWASSSRG